MHGKALVAALALFALAGSAAPAGATHVRGT
jgi:hypothetical protein